MFATNAFSGIIRNGTYVEKYKIELDYEKIIILEEWAEQIIKTLGDVYVIGKIFGFNLQGIEVDLYSNFSCGAFGPVMQTVTVGEDGYKAVPRHGTYEFLPSELFFKLYE